MMFRCIPCLGTKGPWEDIAVHMKGMQSQTHHQPDQRIQESEYSTPASATVVVDEMAEQIRRLKKNRKKKKEKQIAMSNGGRRQRHQEGEGRGGPEEEKGGANEEEEEEEEKEEEYWVAEVDLGVLITFAPLPGGGNCIHKIRFREDMFDASEAQKWWSDNCEKILNLYSVQRRHEAAPLQSDVKIPGTSAVQESDHTQAADDSECNYAVSASSCPAHHKASIGGGHELKRMAPIPGKLVEWVVEDQPGVLITVRSVSDGTKQIRRVELSREKFGDVKARVWWEENKDRLHRHYT